MLLVVSLLLSCLRLYLLALVSLLLSPLVSDAGPGPLPKLPWAASGPPGGPGRLPGSLLAALGPLLGGLRLHLEPLGSLLGGHWRCWRAQSAFYEKVLLARAGCMEMVVLEGCWRLLGRCLVVLGGSWRLLGRSGVALGSCWLDQPVSLTICRMQVWQLDFGTRGGGRKS